MTVQPSSNWGGFWIIRDFLGGIGRHRLDQLWHFAPEAKVELDSTEGSAVVRTGDVILKLLPVQPFPLKAVPYRGNKDTFLGWFSPAYGITLKSPVLSYQGVTHIPLDLTILLVATLQTEKDPPTANHLISMADKTLKRIPAIQRDSRLR